jgi:hypothetical protein
LRRWNRPTIWEVYGRAEPTEEQVQREMNRLKK